VSRGPNSMRTYEIVKRIAGRLARPRTSQAACTFKCDRIERTNGIDGARRAKEFMKSLGQDQMMVEHARIRICLP